MFMLLNTFNSKHYLLYYLFKQENKHTSKCSQRDILNMVKELTFKQLFCHLACCIPHEIHHKVRFEYLQAFSLSYYCQAPIKSKEESL